MPGEHDGRGSSRVEIEERGHALTIRLRWFQGAGVFILGFAILWNGVLVFFYQLIPPHASWVALLFPLIHLSIGFALLYAALGMLLNRTTIRIEEGMLTARHHPVPWRGGRRLQTREIERLHLERRVINNRTKHGRTTPITLHWIYADLRGGKRCALTRGVARESDARLVAGEIERWLDLAPTAG